MKKAVIVILALIIIILGIFFIISRQNKYNYQIEDIKNFEYYIYKENGQFGVINKNADIIINAKYSNIIIPNPQKDLFICYNGENTEILNSKGEKKFEEYETVKEIKLKNVASTLTYEKNVLMYKKDNLYGLIDFKGKVITKNIYDSIENLKPTEGKFLVSKDGKYGVIDLKGNELVDIKYDNILSDEYYTEESGYKKSGFIISNKTEDGYKYGYVSYKGKNILEPKYNEISRISKEDDKKILLIVSENGKYGLYDGTKKIIENEYQALTYDDNVELVILQKNKKYGVQTLDGKEILKTEYDAVSSKGLYIYAESGNEQKVYDIKGNVTNLNYNKAVYVTNNENYKISTLVNNNITYYGIMDKNQKQLVPENYRYIEYLYNDYFIATNEEGNLGVINSNGETVLDMKYSFLQKLKDKNIIQAGESESNITEFYSENMEKVLEVANANIELQKDFIIISNNEGKQYLDNSGKVLNDISGMQDISYPDEIGEYKREQITIENVYYIKE